MKKTYLTVLSSESYLPGVIILHNSLQKHCHIGLTVLCRDDLNEKVFRTLTSLGISWIVMHDDVLPDTVKNASPNERAQKFGEWERTFFKLKMFELDRFEKIVYLDSDMIVVGNIDDLFDYPDMSAVPDSLFYCKRTEDINSGILVFIPKTDFVGGIQSELLDQWNEGRYPFGDQEIISRYWRKQQIPDSHHLPLEYNAAVSRMHLYKPHIKPKVYHYVNHYKPWNMKYGYFARVCYSMIHLRFQTAGALLIAYFANQKMLKNLKEVGMEF